jgi:hypothetical protein
LSFYRAWAEIESDYAKPQNYDFAATIPSLRIEFKNELPWAVFSAALSNAGYAEGRIRERHEILMSFILREYPDMPLKGTVRTLSDEQKIAIWDRANRQCEHVASDGTSCAEVFANFRDADADHIVRWTDGGSTSLSNGRLLCQAHNRANAVASAS